MSLKSCTKNLHMCDCSGLKHLNQFRIDADICMHSSGAIIPYEGRVILEVARPAVDAWLALLQVDENDLDFFHRKIGLWTFLEAYHRDLPMIDPQHPNCVSFLKMASDAVIERAPGKTNADLLQRFFVWTKSGELYKLKQTLSDST